jgi:hypothetical protein
LSFFVSKVPKQISSSFKTNINNKPHPFLLLISLIKRRPRKEKKMENAAIELAETIQTASIKHDPSPEHDINPSTAASRKEPVTAAAYATDEHHDDDDDDDADDDDARTTTASAPAPSTAGTAGAAGKAGEATRPTAWRRKRRARKPALPPLPDLRFEQSYLASIRGAETQSKVLWITVRDQVCFLFLCFSCFSFFIYDFCYFGY